MVWRWGKREIIYLLLRCHHQNDSCIKMGSDESYFNVSVGSDGQSQNCPETTTFLKRKESRSGIEPRSFRLKLVEVLLYVVHRNRQAYQGREPRKPTSTFTQLLSSDAAGPARKF